MRLDFHPEALEEYEAAARYYGRRNPEVGRRFVEAVEEAIQRMLEAPFAWQRLDDQFRRCLTHVFPYAVIYQAGTESVLIIAIMHGCQDPDYWRDRISDH
jgi:plasmid stabilization system protein ParE